MDPKYYQLIHVAAALLVFLGLGGMLTGQGGKVSAMLHGIGLLAMLVAGIGFAHKSGYGWPNWMIAKIGCWLLVGAPSVSAPRPSGSRRPSRSDAGRPRPAVALARAFARRSPSRYRPRP
jgi:hypothetical protein